MPTRSAATFFVPKFTTECFGVPSDPRGERLQIMLTRNELKAVDNWRFTKHMPSRAAAVRELLRCGLSVEGFAVADGTTKSGDYEVVANEAKTGKAQRNTNAAARATPKKA